jgi:hypothetical protein|tara:strand:- start:504 stop:2798 length:2295 start_codon:yes stop_codon:yes gene_type:complete
MHYKLKLLFLIVIIVTSNSLQSQIPTNGLVGYWPFSGNANDSSGNNLNGTVNGAVLTVDRFGNSSSAFNFDGIDDYILVNDDDLLSFPNNEFTFSFWVNPTLTQLPASPAFEEDFESINYWGGDLSFTVQNDKWVRHSGATASLGTGPNGAQSGSKYRYYETTIPGDYHSVPYHGSMYSPAIDLTTSDSSELSFYFHAYGAKMGTLNVKVGSSSLGYTTVYTLSGQQQTSSSAPWQNVTVDLSAFLGEVVQLEFEYTSQVGQDCFTGDIAIDNITVSQSTQYYYSSEIGIMGKREFNQPYVNDWEYNVFGATDTTLGLVCWTNNGQNGVFGNGQSVLHSMNFTPGVWTNFIYSSDGDSLRYYKNGVKLGTIPKNTYGLNLSNQDGDLTFGLAGEWNQFRYLDGKLDDILMYDRALTQTEIDSISLGNYLPCSSVTATDTRSECDSYTWIDGNTYTTNNNSATFNFVGGAASGCDSIVSLNLTITNNYTTSDTIVYYVSNVEFQSNSPKTYLESIDSTLSTNGGCDSIVLNYINYVFNPNNCTDTSIISVYDSILINDTINIYDTTFINSFDTTFITNYDTTFITVFDSVLVLDSISIYDTTFINTFDTTFITNYDTTFITVFDSVLVIDSISIFDTTFVTYYDTNYISIYDTITYYDSVLISVTDTLIINVNLSGISSPNNSNTLKIYPNPANDIVFIDNGNFNSMSNYNLKIINSLGQEVFNSFITIPQFQIPITSFGGLGLYYIQLYNDTGGLLEIRKLIIQ